MQEHLKVLGDVVTGFVVVIAPLILMGLFFRLMDWVDRQ